MAGDDPKYLKHLRSLRCCMFDGQCTGVGVEAHHTTRGRGVGQKSSDTAAFPFCMRHHAQFHRASGDFEGWDRARRAAFQDEMSRKYRAAYEAAHDAPAAGAKLPTLSPPAIPPNDPRAFAEQFCRAHELGPQVSFDLERWLRRYEKSFGP
jgi:hypothetical protein